MSRWIVIYGKYEGLEKKAINMINGAVFELYNDYLSFYESCVVGDELLKNNNLIIVGTNTDNRIISDLYNREVIKLSDKPQGYSIAVTDSPFNSNNQIMLIAGYDESGILYGAADFINKYLGNIIYKTGVRPMEYKAYFETPFKERAPEWNCVSSPSIKTRALWTWGHCIYDYKGFFENMARLKLNEIVIWNDHAPINACEVVDYAHSLGIKVIWGYAWGWGTDCSVSMKLDTESMKALKKEIISTYEREYKDSGCDGIYFQSCTELSDEYIGDKLIAEVVVEFVNDTAGELLSLYPNLHIQFGLHSKSVEKRLEYIAKVDPRVMIAWENCGVFPFSNALDHGFEKDYPPLDETLDFTKKISTLRAADEQFAAVFKGICTLDWSRFKHQEERLILGEKSRAFIKKRAEEKQRILNFRQAGWIRHPEYVQRVVKLLKDTREENTVQIVLEDGLFEYEIPLPAALYAETLWDCERDGRNILCEVMKFPCVKISDLV
jgi:hypothetical protein